MNVMIPEPLHVSPVCVSGDNQAVAKKDLLLLKKCCVCFKVFECHFHGDAMGTGPPRRPLLALTTS